MQDLANFTSGPSCRPAFRDGQVLHAADLGDEAAAIIAAQRRHQALAHYSGIVAGLWLLNLENAKVVYLSPGMAVDGAGRTILVPAEEEIKLPPDDASPPFEVWLAYSEANVPPASVAEGYDLLFEPPGTFDPQAPAAHPRQAVFLGTLNGENLGVADRVYVGAIGSRVAGPSGRTRLLLGPETPSDLRVFAVGSRADRKAKYADHVVMETSGVLGLRDAVEIWPLHEPTAVVAVGHRSLEFVAADIKDTVAFLRRLKSFVALLPSDDAQEFPLPPLPEGGADVRPAVRLTRLLNQLLAWATGAGAAPVAEAVRILGVPLRPQTLRLTLDRNGGSPRADAARLARLLLEDAFPDDLQRQPEDDAPVRGATFTGTRPEPTAALAGRVYLAAVQDKTGPRRELRIEFANPGKDNNPERYKVSLGTVRPSPRTDGSPRSLFEFGLTVDAAGNVTLPSDLRVYQPDAHSGDQPKGMILRVKPAGAAGSAGAAGTAGAAGAGAADPATKADQLGQVAPWDLAIVHAVVNPAWKTDKALTIEVELQNTGKAPILGVQLHASAFATANTAFDPVRKALAYNLVLQPGELVNVLESGTKLPLTLPLSADLQKVDRISLILMTVGAGPGNVIATDQRRLDL